MSWLATAAGLVLVAVAASSCGTYSEVPSCCWDASAGAGGANGGHAGTTPGAAASGPSSGGTGAGGEPSQQGGAGEGGEGIAPQAGQGGAGVQGGAGDAGGEPACLVCPGPDPVDLGAAADFAILTKAGISTVAPSVITGDIGVSPIAATAITGFVLILDPVTGSYATSLQVVGKVFAASYAAPTPAKLIVAIGDMEGALTDALGRPADVTELGAGDIGGRTLEPGVYSWSSGLGIPTAVTLTGDGVFIFQIAQDLTVSNAASVELSGGATAGNIFWAVTGHVDLGTTSHLEGTVLCKTSVALKTGAAVNGRILAQTASTLQQSTVAKP